MKKYFALAALSCSMTLLFMAGGASAQTTLDKVKARGAVEMGFWNEPPFNFTENDKITGADVEVLRAVLAKMGIPKIDGVMQDFSALIPGLMAQRFDMNSAFFVSPARCKQVLFSSPIWVVTDSFLVKAGNPKKLHSYEDVLANPDAKVGYLAGGVEKKNMEKLGIGDDQIVVMNDQPSALAAVRAGRIDAFVNTGIGIQKILDVLKDPALERAEPFKPSIIDGKKDVGYGAFSFRLEDKAFRDAFNQALVAFIGTPEHVALVRPFGFSDEEIKPIVGMSTETACKG